MVEFQICLEGSTLCIILDKNICYAFISHCEMLFFGEGLFSVKTFPSIVGTGMSYSSVKFISLSSSDKCTVLNFK